MSEHFSRCIFCGNPGRTHEHLFGNWLGEHIDVPSNPKHHKYRDSPIGETVSIGNGLAASAQIKAPCGLCNSSWMGRIEDTAKPLIERLMTGSPERLDRLQQLTLAMWLTIKAMVWESQDGVLKCIPQSDRDFVYLNREPAAWKLPPDWRVWIGQTNGEVGHCGAFSGARLVVLDLPDGTIWPPPTAETPANSNVFALHTGRLFLMSMRCPFISRGLQFRAGGKYSRVIWPYENGIDWPPDNGIEIGEVSILVKKSIDRLFDLVRLHK